MDERRLRTMLAAGGMECAALGAGAATAIDGHVILGSCILAGDAIAGWIIVYVVNRWRQADIDAYEEREDRCP